MKRLKLTRLTAVVTGVIVSVPLIAGGLFVYFNGIAQASYAAPQDLRINDITSSSAAIVWTTDREAQSIVEYGTSPSSMDQIAIEPAATRNHTVNLTVLSPGTTYHFVIRVDDTVYDNGGVPWFFTTKKRVEEEKTATDSASFSKVPDATASAGLSPTTTPSPVPTQGEAPTSTFTPQPATTTARVATAPSRTPTPTKRINCSSRDCQQILENIGPGKCTSADHIRCLYRNAAPTPTPAQPQTPTQPLTPTSIPTPTVLTPTDLKATATSNTQIDLVWEDKSSNEDGFEIERALFSSSPSFSVIATVSAGIKQYSNSGLTPSTSYVYRVRAFIITGSGKSGYSNTAIATTQQ